MAIDLAPVDDEAARRVEGDKDDLLDSVKRIARKTIDETVAAGLPGGGDE